MKVTSRDKDSKNPLIAVNCREEVGFSRFSKNRNAIYCTLTHMSSLSGNGDGMIDFEEFMTMMRGVGRVVRAARWSPTWQ